MSQLYIMSIICHKVARLGHICLACVRSSWGIVVGERIAERRLRRHLQDMARGGGIGDPEAGGHRLKVGGGTQQPLSQQSSESELPQNAQKHGKTLVLRDDNVPLRINFGGRNCWERGYTTAEEFKEMAYGKPTGDSESPIAKNTSGDKNE